MTIAAPPGWQIRVCLQLNEPQVQCQRRGVSSGLTSGCCPRIR